MRYLTFGEEQETYPICILVPKIEKDKIEREFITPFNLNPEEVIVIELYRDPVKKKTSVADIKEFIESELKDTLNDLQTTHVIVANADYFKVLTGNSKAEPRLGYVDPSKYGSWKCAFSPSPETVFYDPANVRARIARAFEAVKDDMAGTISLPGSDIIQFEEYPKTCHDIWKWLQKLHQYEELTCDVETFSLKFHTAGLGTIGFAWNQGEGIAFPIDLMEKPGDAKRVRKYLKDFFKKYRGTLTFHNIGFDGTVLIYQLFMKDIMDTKGLLYGLRCVLRSWHDTKLITYLATNTCAGNTLGLKDQASEFAGDFAEEDIADITKIPLDQLLRYNLVDCLSTWYVKQKHWDTMVRDQQLELYNGLFHDTMVDIIQMQLTGLPINMQRVKEVEKILLGDSQGAYDNMMSTHVMQDFLWVLRREDAEKRNAKWKKKRITAEESDVVFNPNSDLQKRSLLYDHLKFPVIDKTDSGLPSTGGDSIKKMLHQTQDEDVLKLLKALIAHADVAIIIQNFLPSLLNAVEGPDGWHYMFGNFNLGGTISGRLSSSKPNLQNIPAKGKYAKVIKSCFEAPPGWLFCGLDFASLEDRISALTTKDPNKLKVYSGSKQYNVTVNGVTHCIREDTIVSYDGVEMTGEKLYELLQNHQT